MKRLAIINSHTVVGMYVNQMLSNINPTIAAQMPMGWWMDMTNCDPCRSQRFHSTNSLCRYLREGVLPTVNVNDGALLITWPGYWTCNIHPSPCGTHTRHKQSNLTVCLLTRRQRYIARPNSKITNVIDHLTLKIYKRAVCQSTHNILHSTDRTFLIKTNLWFH